MPTDLYLPVDAVTNIASMVQLEAHLNEVDYENRHRPHVDAAGHHADAAFGFFVRLIQEAIEDGRDSEGRQVSLQARSRALDIFERKLGVDFHALGRSA